jgi:mycothiol synthase
VLDITVLAELDADTRRVIDMLALLAEGADGFPSLSDHQRLQLQFGTRDEFIPIVARDGRHLIGYGHLTSTDDVWTLQVITHPNRRFDGVEHAIATQAIAHASSCGGAAFELWRFNVAAADDVLAGQLKLAPHRDLVQLRCPLPRTEKPTWPAGIAVRTFDPGGDSDAWLTANARVFAGHTEQALFHSQDLERRMRTPWFDPTGFLLAVNDTGAIVGFCWTKTHSAHALGEIYVIGVDPDHRATGLGRALVLAGLDHLEGQGYPQGMLYADAENIAALELYSAVGFTEHHRDRLYRSTL